MLNLAADTIPQIPIYHRRLEHEREEAENRFPSIGFNYDFAVLATKTPVNGIGEDEKKCSSIV